MNIAMPKITAQDAGENLHFGGGLITFKITSEQSGGVLCMFEHTSSYGKVTPLHLHLDEDETGYILEGEFLFHIDGNEHRAGPGSVVWIPRGTAHAFMVVSELARSIWVVTPGEVMESFYRQAGDAVMDRSLPSVEIDIPRIVAAGESTGAMKTLGPPPFSVNKSV